MLQANKNKSLLIFDWDGTLLNSINSIIQCKIDIAEDFNVDIPSPDTIKSCLGMPFEIAMSRCFPKLNSDDLNKVCLEFSLRIKQQKYQSPLYPNVQSILIYLKNAGHTLTIATSKNRDEFNQSIIDTACPNVFSKVICGGEAGSKPNPSIIEHIQNNFDIEKEQTFVIGDTSIDQALALNANVHFIGVTYGAHDKETLLSNKTYALINSIDELQNIF